VGCCDARDRVCTLNVIVYVVTCVRRYAAHGTLRHFLTRQMRDYLMSKLAVSDSNFDTFRGAINASTHSVVYVCVLRARGFVCLCMRSLCGARLMAKVMTRTDSPCSEGDSDVSHAVVCGYSASCDTGQPAPQRAQLCWAHTECGTDSGERGSDRGGNEVDAAATGVAWTHIAGACCVCRVLCLRNAWIMTCASRCVVYACLTLCAYPPPCVSGVWLAAV
jgi:hypothetical protein